MPGILSSYPGGTGRLQETAVTIPEPDLERVAIISWYMADSSIALAVLEAPDVFAAACAGAPPTDWTLYDTHYHQTVHGPRPGRIRRNGIIADAPDLKRHHAHPRVRR